MCWLSGVPGLVVNLVTKTGGIDNRQGDASALLVQLQLCVGVSLAVAGWPDAGYTYRR